MKGEQLKRSRKVGRLQIVKLSVTQTEAAWVKKHLSIEVLHLQK